MQKLGKSKIKRDKKELKQNYLFSSLTTGDLILTTLRNVSSRITSSFLTSFFPLMKSGPDVEVLPGTGRELAFVNPALLASIGGGEDDKLLVAVQRTAAVVAAGTMGFLK